jgi:hypothetical protein
MPYSICPECQHHNRVASVLWDSIPTDWKHQIICAVCEALFTADASNSYIVHISARTRP